MSRRAVRVTVAVRKASTYAHSSVTAAVPLIAVVTPGVPLGSLAVSAPTATAEAVRPLPVLTRRA
jgi:hypothetical protein